MKVNLHSEDWLPLLMRLVDLLARPTPHNILRSFEDWEQNTLIRRNLRTLQRAGMIERQKSDPHGALQFTKRGCLAASGGVNPVNRWQRTWDRTWRMLMFDLPARRNATRLRLWRHLRSSRFGYLQNSVWLSPDAISEELLPLNHLKLNPDSLLVFEGHPANRDVELVNSAWDFAEINRRYELVRDVALRGLKLAESATATGTEFCRWLAEDREAWMAAIALDPLLPAVLFPAGYLGQQAWADRETALNEMAKRCAQIV